MLIPCLQHKRGVIPIGFDGLLLRCLVRELDELLVNARVHHIAQPQANDIVLTLRKPGANYRLLLSADPTVPRVHLSAVEQANPLTPPAFCMLLRKHLAPARLLSIRQVGLDRIIELRFEARDEMGRRVERLLITEMMGRHSNTVLIDPVTNLILDGVRHVTSEQSRYREVLPGKPYISPPAQDKKDPFQTSENEFLFALRHTPAPVKLAEALVKNFDGIGPDAAREILARAHLHPEVQRADVDPGQMRSVWHAFHDVSQRIATGNITPWCLLDTTGRPTHYWVLPLTGLAQTPGYAAREPLTRIFASTNELLDWYHALRYKHKQVEDLRQMLQRTTQAAWDRVTKRIALQEQALREAELSEDYRLRGELLLAYPHLVAPKAKQASLPNYYESDMLIDVELDPALSATENAQVFFKRYQKAKKTQQQAQEQLTAALSEQAYLESVLDAVERATELEDLIQIRTELEAQKLLPPDKKKVSVDNTANHLQFTALDGTRILVGKNNRQNDAITMSIAGSDDLWLHVKDIPGSHVIVRNNGAPISDDTLTLALHLAAYYSRARNSSQVPVDYCLRRYVRKPKGAKPGYVIYERQKTAYITPDWKEITRLQR
ncbi:MAG: Rqc2 family fibronectin-binding protein [Limnochordia bacterium]